MEMGAVEAKSPLMSVLEIAQIIHFHIVFIQAFMSLEVIIKASITARSLCMTNIFRCKRCR